MLIDLPLFSCRQALPVLFAPPRGSWALPGVACTCIHTLVTADTTRGLDIQTRGPVDLLPLLVLSIRGQPFHRSCPQSEPQSGWCAVQFLLSPFPLMLSRLPCVVVVLWAGLSRSSAQPRTNCKADVTRCFARCVRSPGDPREPVTRQRPFACVQCAEPRLVAATAAVAAVAVRVGARCFVLGWVVLLQGREQSWRITHLESSTSTLQ